MLTKEQLVTLLCRKRFPKADAMYEVYKTTGALELPQPIAQHPKTWSRPSPAALDRLKAHYEEIRSFENWLLSRTYEQLREEECVEKRLKLTHDFHRNLTHPVFA